MVERLAREHEVSDHHRGRDGGRFGSLVLHHLAARGLLDRGLKIRPLALPDRFIATTSRTCNMTRRG